MKFVFLSILGINLLIFSSLARGADCKSLSATRCKSSDSCVYVKGSKRGTTKVSAYCRAKPGKSNGITKKKTKKVSKKSADKKTAKAKKSATRKTTKVTKKSAKKKSSKVTKKAKKTSKKSKKKLSKAKKKSKKSKG